MSQTFIVFGGKDKKLALENTTHPCPRCKRANTVQLTRSETYIILFNKRIELPRNMKVRYECQKCHWKNETLPDDDPSFQAIPCITEDEKFLNTHYRQRSVESCSTKSSVTSNSTKFKRNAIPIRNTSSINF